MLIICVTHARPDYSAAGTIVVEERACTEKTGQKCRELVGEDGVVVGVFSSPRLRCVETTAIIAAELARSTREELRFRRILGSRDDVPATKLITRLDLDEWEKALHPQCLARVLEYTIEAVRSEVAEILKTDPPGDPVLILGVHGDLANALGLSEGKHTERTDKGLFFKPRPVVALLDYEPGYRPGDRVRTCGFFKSNVWINIVA